MSIQASLRRVPTSNASSLVVQRMVAAGLQQLATSSAGGPRQFDVQQTEMVTNNVNITSLKVPIASIGISDGDHGSTASGSTAFSVYNCAGPTSDDCLVELTGDALSNLLGHAPPADVRVGTFTKVNISPCVNNNGNNVHFKITATVPNLKLNPNDTGTLYYTNATTGLSLTGPAEEVTIDAGLGCNATNYLTEPLIISALTTQNGNSTADGNQTSDGNQAGDSNAGAGGNSVVIDLKLYFDIANVATASGGTSNQGAGVPGQGCKAISAQQPFICLNFPDVVATVDPGTPTVKRFLLTDAGSTPIFSPTIMGLYFASTESVPFGAYLRPYLDGVNRPVTETLQGSTFNQFTATSGGNVTINTYYDWLTFRAFPLTSHTGVMLLDKHNDPSANPTSLLNGSEPYTADLLP